MKFGLLVLVGFSVCALGLTGCETLVDSNGENFDRMAHAVDTDGKMIPMDTEQILLLYKPTELSAEPVPMR